MSSHQETYLSSNTLAFFILLCSSSYSLLLIGRMYSSLMNSTPQGIIRTGVGIPSLGFLFGPRFFIFATLGYYSALCITYLPPQVIIPLKVIHFCQPLLLFHLRFCTPRFSTFVNPRLLFHPSFLFFPPQATIKPQVFNICLPQATTYSALGVYSARMSAVLQRFDFLQQQVSTKFQHLS